jgi:hypothetical protein
MAAKQGPNVLFFMQNRTKCILLSDVLAGGTAHSAHRTECTAQHSGRGVALSRAWMAARDRRSV